MSVYGIRVDLGSYFQLGKGTRIPGRVKEVLVEGCGGYPLDGRKKVKKFELYRRGRVPRTRTVRETGSVKDLVETYRPRKSKESREESTAKEHLQEGPVGEIPSRGETIGVRKTVRRIEIS